MNNSSTDIETNVKNNIETNIGNRTRSSLSVYKILTQCIDFFSQ